MIVEFRSSVTNNIDGSNTPVALIDAAIEIIEKADEQFARMDWEQEADKSAYLPTAICSQTARKKTATEIHL